MTVLPPDAGQILLPLARQFIETALRNTAPARAAGPGWLLQTGATCVTLHANGAQRGRALTLEPRHAIADDLAANAVAAALRDPAHRGLSLEEWAGTTVEVAVLSDFDDITHSDEGASIACLRSGHDGVFVRYGRHHSHFLPEMWAQYPEPGEFLAALKYRAGLPPDFWDGAIRLARCQVQCWRE